MLEMIFINTCLYMYLKNAAYSDIVKSVVCCDCMSILKYAGTTSILSCISEKTETKKKILI